MCELCLDRKARQDQSRIDRGQCLNCSKPHEPGHRKCSYHMERQRMIAQDHRDTADHSGELKC
jgi:hypothetical protein